MNPSWKLFLILIISLEISFTRHLTANVIIIVICAAILLVRRLHWLTYIRLLIVPAIPAAALAITVGAFTPQHNWFFAWVLITRIYAYVGMGTCLTTSTTSLTLARSLEQNAHLGPKYAYGVLAAINLVPQTISAVKTIRASGRMRGVNLHIYSPRLYFKAILQALRWSEQISEAMISHGFVEGQARTHAQHIPVKRSDYLLFIGSILILQLLIFALP